MRRIDGYLFSQLIYVAAELGVADVLAGRPALERRGRRGGRGRSGGAAPRAAGLVLEHVVAEDDDRRFALTELGALLRTDAAGSLRGPALARGRVYYGAAAGLLETVRAGGTAFEHVHGEPFFDHLARHPEREASFQDSMAGRAARETAAVVAAYDFTRARRSSTWAAATACCSRRCCAPRRAWRRAVRPAPRGRPGARAPRRRRPRRALRVRGRRLLRRRAGRRRPTTCSRACSTTGTTRPAGRILAACRRALPAGGRLLVVEALLPERAADAPGAITMDLHMLVLLGARERTEAEYGALLASAGLRLERAHPAGELTVLEAVAA